MSSTSEPFTFKQLISEIIAYLARSISERHGETPRHKEDRVLLATQMVLAFFPRDVVEIMLTSRVILFHEISLDAAHEMLRGQTDPMRRSTRANIIAFDRCFHANLAKLEQYQTRRTDGVRDDAGNEPATAQAANVTPANAQPRVGRPAATAPAQPSSRRPATSTTQGPIEPMAPPPQAIAALQRNEAALAALDASDPIAFAKAMGIENPRLDLGAAAAQWAELFDELAADESSGQDPAAA